LFLFHRSGSEGITDDNELFVDHIKGKPVTSVIGTTPIEAWAHVLIKLGLIDEIMYEHALECIAENRAQGIAEVEGRMETIRNQRREARARQVMKQKGILSDSKESKVKPTIDGEESTNDLPVKVEGPENVVEEMKGDKTDTEIALEQKFNKLLQEYQDRLEATQKITIDLANRRIEAMGPFLMNPFHDYDLSVNQQKNWLTTVIKKEKSKMGSTGNKRKIVTPTDILDRNANFYNADIERLLEGLPGTEYCPDYIFHEMRSAGATTYTILHDVKLRKEKEKQTKKRHTKEKLKRLSVNKEKQKKRKRVEDEKSSRKRAKDDEVDQVKQARKEERYQNFQVRLKSVYLKKLVFKGKGLFFLHLNCFKRNFSEGRRQQKFLLDT
jgi:hypothetical protein